MRRREKVATAIERELFRQAEPARGEFRKLRNLIRLLGRLGGGASGGPLTRLLEKELDYVASQPQEPPSPIRWLLRPRYRDERDEAVNHPLAWLATAIDEQVVTQQFGQRLVKLRDATKGHWKAELQRALDDAHVEDNLELAALERAQRVESVRSTDRIAERKGGYGDRLVDLRFSADGRTLRTVGKDGAVCTWDATTMKLLRRISLPVGRRVASIRHSDGRYALCPSTGDPNVPIPIIDLETGKTLTEVALPLTWNSNGAAPRDIACNAGVLA